MKYEKFDSVNILAIDLETTMSKFSNITGSQFAGPIDHGSVRVAYDNLGLAIKQPMSPDSDLAKSMAKLPTGQGIHSISIKVPNRDEAVKELEAKGVRCQSTEDMPGLKTAQMNPADIFNVWIELVEYNTVPPIALANLRKAHEMPHFTGYEGKPKLRIDKVDHVHFFVKELEATARCFSDIFGLEFIGPVGGGSMRVAFGSMGDMGFELIQPLEDNVFAQHAEQLGGEGLFAVGYLVPDIDEGISVFEANGVRCNIKNNPSPRYYAARFGSIEDTYGTWIELVQWDTTPPLALAHMDKIGLAPLLLG